MVKINKNIKLKKGNIFKYKTVRNILLDMEILAGLALDILGP